MLLLTLILSLLIVLVLINFSKILQFIRAYYLYKKLPGPSWHQVTNVTFRLLRIKESELFDLIAYFLAVKERTCGGVMFGKFFTAILHHKELERLLSSTIHIGKGEQYNTTMLWLKEGLLTSKGNKWHNRRKILTPTLHFKLLQDSLQVMNNNAKILVEKFSKTGGVPFEISDYITLCTLDIICETAMGIKRDFQKDKAVEYVQDIKRACRILTKKEITFWMHCELIFRLSPMYKELKQIISRLHAFTDKVITNRKEAFRKSREKSEVQGEKRRMAFLDCLIDTELKNPGTFTNLDMREEVDTFMFAGHDTTATAISFCLLHLGGEKEVQERTVEELDKIFGESDRPVTMNDLPEMKYLEMVIKETLRLCPSVPYISRYITEDFILEDGTVIPAGSNLAIIPYLLHRNPNYFTNPDEFDPERFNEENIKNIVPFSYIPFSAGPRNCIGQKFAMMELKIIISTILRAFRLESVVHWKELKLMPQIVLKPDRPIKIKLISRST